MLNRPWIDPRTVDWTDALNGVRNPGWRQNNNPYVFAALKDPFLVALRNAKGIEPRAYVCPDPENQSVPAGATYDYEVPSEPNTWLWGICASVGNPIEDVETAFLLQVTDSETGATLFSQPVNSQLVTGIPLVGTTPTPKGSGNGYRGPIMFLSTPHLFAPPSFPVVRIINVSASRIAVCRVTLFCCVEYVQTEVTE